MIGLIFSFGVLLLYTASTYSLKINISGPDIAQRRNTFMVNCTSDVIPADETVEFIVDGKTEDTLRRYEGRCFSTRINGVCMMETCLCSGDGLVYSVTIDANTMKESLNVTCSMKFSTTSPVFTLDSIKVQIIDILSTEGTLALNSSYFREKMTYPDNQETSFSKNTTLRNDVPINKEAGVKGSESFVNAYTIGSLTVGVFLLLLISILAISAYKKLVCEIHSSGKETSSQNKETDNKAINDTTENTDTYSQYESIDERELIENTDNIQRNQNNTNRSELVQPASQPEAVYLDVLDDTEYERQHDISDLNNINQGYEIPLSDKQNRFSVSIQKESTVRYKNNTELKNKFSIFL